MDVEAETYEDDGTLFFVDGRKWGDAHYVVDVTRSGVSGLLAPMEPTDNPNPFLAFGPKEVDGALLRMSDGRWWWHTLQPSGKATHRGGSKVIFYPAGPMPKVV
jgi:hypothetical protein